MNRNYFFVKSHGWIPFSPLKLLCLVYLLLQTSAFSQIPGPIGDRNDSPLQSYRDQRTALALSPFTILSDSYANALIQQPILTKACTGFVLCGAGDVIAQARLNNQEQNEVNSFDFLRFFRFAGKGFFGTLIWMVWYNFSDTLVPSSSIVGLVHNLPGMKNVQLDEFGIGIIRTLTLIVIEQFVTCPIIYSCWEIPVATLLNGASPRVIPNEIRNKLGGMLVDNAKIWTWANLVIYNVPVQYRSLLGNIFDLLWQSIVSDYAAKCGTDGQYFLPLIDDSSVKYDSMLEIESTGILGNRQLDSAD